VIEAKLDPVVAKKVPGTMLDDEAIALVNTVIEAVDAALADGADMKVVLEKLVAQDFPGAFKALEDLILNAFKPATEHGHKVVAVLKAA
jgi:hypothetical protein